MSIGEVAREDAGEATSKEFFVVAIVTEARAVVDFDDSPTVVGIAKINANEAGPIDVEATVDSLRDLFDF